MKLIQKVIQNQLKVVKTGLKSILEFQKKKKKKKKKKRKRKKVNGKPTLTIL